MALSDIRDGLGDRLRTISGLRVYDRRPNQLHHPAAIIKRVSSPARVTYTGHGVHRFEITMLVKHSDIDRAQTELDAYIDLIGTNSIRAALEADNTLGGTAEYIDVGDWGEDEDIVYNDMEFLGARLPVEVAVTY